MNTLLRLHRPLMLVAAAMIVIALVAIVGMFVDPREVTGVNVWTKPLKFALSIAIYSVTLAWLISLVKRRVRLARIAGTVVAIGLISEMIPITGFAIVGDTSHFNVSTPLHVTVWSIMATSISVVWVFTLLIGIALFRSSLGDSARSFAIRAGVLVGVLGMGLAFLMTSPSADQLSNFQGVAGAHTVGLADGGAGLPILGWSTIGGDLRIPHFVGMHAMQLLPLLVLALEALGRRYPRLDAVTRFRLVVLATIAYLASLAVLTVQALAGQSIVHPAGEILAAGVAIAVLGVGFAAAIITVGPAVPQASLDRELVR
jgi:hypothetical protein